MERNPKYVFTTTASILLIIGWLLTSKDARTYISEQPRMKTPMTVAIVLFLLAEIWFSCDSHRTSKKTLDLIRAALAKNQDGLIAEDYYLPKSVPRSGVIGFVTAHAVLYVLLGSIIWSIC